MAPFLESARRLFEIVNSRIGELGGQSEIAIGEAYRIIAEHLQAEHTRGLTEGRAAMREQHVEQMKKRGQLALDNFIASMQSPDGFSR